MSSPTAFVLENSIIWDNISSGHINYGDRKEQIFFLSKTKL